MAAKKEDTVKDEQLRSAELKIAEMLEQAQKEAQRIIDEAKAAVEVTKQAKDEAISAEREAELARCEELVEVKLFKDNDKYKEPVFVGVNGEAIAIERGVRVQIKRKFAEVLDNSDKQDYETAKLIERKTDEFSKSGL